MNSTGAVVKQGAEAAFHRRLYRHQPREHLLPDRPADARLLSCTSSRLNNMVANTFLANVHLYPDGTDSISFTVDLIQRRGWQCKHIAIDEHGWFVPIAVYKALLARLDTLRDGVGLIEQLRAVKSPAEIAAIRNATYVERRGRSHDVGRHRRGQRVSWHGAVNVERIALGCPARHLASAQDRRWRPRVLRDGRGARSQSRRAHALGLARPATGRGKAHDGHLPRRPRRRARRPHARQHGAPRLRQVHRRRQRDGAGDGDGV